MEIFTWPPAWNASLNVRPRVLSAQFGDGYEQRIADGINNMPRSWSLTFTNPLPISIEIDNFLNARKGYEAFDWTPPDGAAGRFVCKEWSYSHLAPNARTISATFIEVFGS